MTILTPEQVLAIAASQWDGMPTPRQILRALEAGGYSVVSKAEMENGPLGFDYGLTGSQIGDLRKYLGISQADLGERAGTQQQIVYKIENGQILDSRWKGAIIRELEKAVAAQFDKKSE